MRYTNIDNLRKDIAENPPPRGYFTVPSSLAKDLLDELAFCRERAEAIAFLIQAENPHLDGEPVDAKAEILAAARSIIEGCRREEE